VRTHWLRSDAAQEAPGSTISASGRPDLRTTTSAFFAAQARARFLEELAYYRADAPFLPVEKCAARCQELCALLALATLDT
jgi:hypothetical protein